MDEKTLGNQALWSVGLFMSALLIYNFFCTGLFFGVAQGAIIGPLLFPKQESTFKSDSVK